MARTPPLTLLRAEPLVSASGELSPALQSPPDTPYTFLRTLPRRRSLKDKVGSGLRKLVARAKSFTAPASLDRPQPVKSRSREYEDVQEPGVKARDFAHRRAASDSMSSIPRLQADLHGEGVSPPKRLPAVILTRSTSTPRVDEETEDEDDEVTSPKAYVADTKPTRTSTSLFGLDEGGSSSCDSDALGSRPEESPTYVDPATQTQSSCVEPLVPSLLVNGTPLLKVTAKKVKQKFFRLDADQGIVTWESNKGGIIQIENIKEIRTGEKARYYREHFKIPLEKEDRWMTISYISDNKYKILHTIAFSQDTMRLWATTLDSLRNVRLNIMSGIVSPARTWEKRYWSGSDMSADGRLEIEEVERLCCRLGIGAGRNVIIERFKNSDKGGKGYLDFTDFQTFVKKLHTRPDIKRLWNRMRGEGLFDLQVFGKFMREEQMMTDMTDSELAVIFKKYATGGSELPTPPPEPETPTSPIISSYKSKRRSHSRSRSRSGSFSFTSTPKFKNAQPASPIVCSYPDKETTGLVQHSVTTPHFTLDDFSTFLFSADNSAFEDREHDMTRPLSEYYISSSHNTYLVGHQLVGESTIEGYIRSLSSGCRSVEVDIWDGDHEPVITHGRTLTGSVSLRHVAQAIAKYAFVASPYPVIISAEMHVGIEQQSMVAQIFKEEFGDMLVTCRLDGTNDLEELECLPSPEELKHRVLLKFKNALLSSVEVEGDTEETDDTTTDTESLNMKDLSRARTIAKRVRSSFRSNRRPDMTEFASYAPPTPTSTLDPSSAVTPTSPTRKKQRAYSNRSELERPKLKMSRSLADLLVYTVGVKFRGLNKKEHYAIEQMFSLSEKTANKVLKENWMGLVKHCRTNLVRVYPNGTRVKSTNYEPARYWAAGAQLVAMNWQTIDLGNMMNQSMFMRNGRAGYLLKPEALRVKDKDLLAKRVEYVLDITIISAQQIPRKRDENGREVIKDELVDPFVEISLHTPDYPNTGPKIFRTSSNPGNGLFNPVWEEAVSIPFTCVADMWDLIFLRLAVIGDEDDDEPLAVYCSPLGSLRKGYRHLPLHDLQYSQYLFSTLFVHVSLRAV